MAASYAPLQILAVNDARTSENRIHSDAEAARHGFRGALVSGINVFGYLTQPLAQAYAGSFLTGSQMDVKFFKPAYEMDRLSVVCQDRRDESGRPYQHSEAHNSEGVLLASLQARQDVELPPPHALAELASGSEAEARSLIHWDKIHIRRPEPAFLWHPSAEENAQRLSVQSESAPVYQGAEGLIHPCFLLDACNKALMRMFVLPAWIHTGSSLILRRPLRVGQAIEVRCTPVAKWERKQHQFIRLYIAMWAEQKLALEVEHTAIFRLATDSSPRE